MSTSFAERYGGWAVVAGASEGLGAAFAEALADRGMNLLLMARREGPLAEIADRLRGRVEVRTVAMDLARPDLATALPACLDEIGDIGVGVYNAAFAPVGDLLARPLDDLLRVVDVNVRGPLVFARTLAPAMVDRRRGALVLMSSLAGFQGAPRLATYAASKAFNTVLAEGLWGELGPHGVDVVGSAAGAIRTPGYARTAAGDAPGTLDAAEVVRQTLDGLGRGPTVIPGRTNQIARFLLGRLLPRRMAVEIMARNTKELT